MATYELERVARDKHECHATFLTLITAEDERLQELVPAFLDKLPHDVINGEPLKYRREANDRFTLWSVGWNGTDEGRTIAWTKDANPRPNSKD